MGKELAEALEYLNERQIKLLDQAIKENNQFEKMHWLRVANSRRKKKITTRK